MDRHAPEHRITVELGDDLLMARMDARLMVQVVINLVNNAIKYTPPGSNIVLSAARRGDMVEVRVADDGPAAPYPSRTTRPTAPFLCLRCILRR